MLSSDTQVPSNNEHQKVWSLLPWSVNQSLDPVEQAIVNRHVKTCITCRIELNQQQQVFENIRHTDLLQQISHASFTRLQKRIEKQPELYVFAKPNQPEKVLNHFPYQFLGSFKYVAIAASILLLALPIIQNTMIDQPELNADYRTLANPIESEQKNNMIRIVFAAPSNSEQISAILNDVSGQIVKGPSPTGIYEVQIGDQQTNLQEVKDAISRLQNNARVIFAELAHGLPSSD
ncbi:MAG: zf-HC2 domain-containing protein [Nitrosomonas sp.]|nr:zf-HC2 domain-containing protein [Nitrosomonas sp.]MBP7112314.1 zf-HC2 domain-containing protein [Nitrosomonas sp.]